LTPYRVCSVQWTPCAWPSLAWLTYTLDTKPIDKPTSAPLVFNQPLY